MPKPDLYPLLFEPQLRHYVWGGRNLEALYGRTLPPGVTAESWEISGHPDSPTRVTNGSLAGRNLDELTCSLGAELIGQRSMPATGTPRFPLLVKLLDAQRDLSVQVHPDDAYAAEHENGERGKVESWYVLQAEKDARLIYGLQPGVDRATMSAAAARGGVSDLLHYLPIAAGDCVYVPAGTVHAVMAGTVVAEIQQTSDATYRIYDWGRVGDDGKPRPLHIDRALDTIRWDAQGPGVIKPRLIESSELYRREGFISCPQFELEMVTLEPGGSYGGACNGRTFEIWGCIEGDAQVTATQCVSLPAVRFTMLPASLGAFTVATEKGARLLRAYVA